MYFGENAGKQCVAMSLSALIYNKIKGIHSCNDLVQIMEMGNQLYSTLSQFTGQVYLMQTELPSMIAMFEKNYQLNYSESYTGNLHHFDSIIEGYQYSMSIDRAFESLLSQNYTSFILTVGCIGVSIYHTDNGSYKIFDSHARDEYGRRSDCRIPRNSSYTVQPATRLRGYTVLIYSWLYKSSGKWLRVYAATPS